MKGKSFLILLLVVVIGIGLAAVSFRGVKRVQNTGYTYDISADGQLNLDENGQPQIKEVTEDVTVEPGRFDSGRPVRYGSYRNIKQGLDLKGGVYIVYEAKDTEGNVFNPSDEQMSAAISMLQQRVDDKGYFDAEVSQEGANRIRVEIPGVTDAQATAEEIGEAAHLTFRDEEGNVLVDGANVTNATKQVQNGEVVVSLEFDSEGKSAFASATQNNVGKQIGIYMDESAISMPRVNQAITDGRAVIQGDFTAEEADDLAAKIRAGSLPFNLNILEYNAVGARLGADSLSTSVKAGLVGIAIVLLFMLIVYRIPGVAADIALCIYTALLVVVMSLLGTTLTLPGLAGIILSIGMAVDANVIIFARIKEEINNGRAVKAAIKNGFAKALSAILDGNITTLISCVVLYWLGTGPVKGFAMTLFLGIVLSMFTALVVTRIIINALYGIGIKNSKLYGGK
ncbi:MAG: protein translocase subunit SecD [Lachnospirales bacterium]